MPPNTLTLNIDSKYLLIFLLFRSRAYPAYFSWLFLDWEYESENIFVIIIRVWSMIYTAIETNSLNRENPLYLLSHNPQPSLENTVEFINSERQDASLSKSKMTEIMKAINNLTNVWKNNLASRVDWKSQLC